MFTRFLTLSAAGIGGLALSLTAAGGIASANPDLGPVVNTTCSYPQAVSALNAGDPATAAQFNASPMAQSWLSSFLSSPPGQREQMAEQAQNSPEGQPYVGAMLQVANTCSNY